MTESICKPLPRDSSELDSELKESFQRGNSLFRRSCRQKLLYSLKGASTLHRSDRECSILLIGTSGVGKSSTANHLFNLNQSNSTQFADISPNTSSTRQTKEYLIQTHSDTYETSDLTVAIIDSPGFQDTAGHVQDACNMFSIQQFFKSHCRLANNYPNLIFVCFSASDVRYQGENSNFTKSLKCLKKLNLVDIKNPNIVAIVTKVCTIRPDHFRKLDEWKSNLEKMKSDIRDIIFGYLDVSCPVVILENKYEKEDLPRGTDDDGRVSEFTTLPTGEQQPLNLFQTCQTLLRNNCDLFGEICLRTCFMNGNVNSPKIGHCVSAKDASIETLSSEEENFVTCFEDFARGVTVDPIAERARQFISEKQIDEDGKKEIREIVSKLKKLGIISLNDLKKHTINSIKYHLFSGSILSNGEDFLTSLNVEEGNDVQFEFPFNCGYNIFIDKSTQHQIFKKNNILDAYGLCYPENFSYQKFNENKTFGDIIENEKFFIMHRHALLNINVEVDPNRYTYQSRPGMTLLRKSMLECSTMKFSKLFEYRQFELKFDYSLCKMDDLSDGFRSDVEQLPSRYSSSDEDSCSKYEAFLKRWGHFFITSVYGGGSVEKIDHVITDHSEQQQLPELNPLRWRGGCAQWHEDETFDDSERMKKWQGSIMTSPVILSSEMRLEPISTAVGICDAEKEREIQNALNKCLREMRVMERKDLEPFVFITREEAVRAMESRGPLDNMVKAASIGADVVKAIVDVVGFVSKFVKF